MPPIRKVVLFGKVGDGKTSLMNKTCGSKYPEGANARSITSHVQCAMMHDDLAVIDTPGFYTSTDVAGHVAAQKVALEGFSLSGIYLVVKYGRADDIAALANTVMGVIGIDDICIAITHEDVYAQQEGFDSRDLQRTVAATLNIDEGNIFSFGKTTPAHAVQQFFQRTLHEPRFFKMSKEQQASVAALGVVGRATTKLINTVHAKILAAEVACRDAVSQGRRYESDFLITTTQHATAEMVQAAKANLFETFISYPEDQQNVLYGKAGVSLSLKLQAFTETTNKLLSYDVTDPSNPNNVYKRCNHCGAVWVKTEGCDGFTTCGNVPSGTKRGKVLLQTEFIKEEQGRWTVLFRHGGKSRSARDTWSWIRGWNPFKQTPTVNKGAGTSHRKQANAIIESGCGAQINWSTMNPLPPELLRDMATVEVLTESLPEESAKVRFENKVREKELENKRIILKAMDPPSKRIALAPKAATSAKTSVYAAFVKPFGGWSG